MRSEQETRPGRARWVQSWRNHTQPQSPACLPPAPEGGLQGGGGSKALGREGGGSFTFSPHRTLLLARLSGHRLRGPWTSCRDPATVCRSTSAVEPPDLSRGPGPTPSWGPALEPASPSLRPRPPCGAPPPVAEETLCACPDPRPRAELLGGETHEKGHWMQGRHRLNQDTHASDTWARVPSRGRAQARGGGRRGGGGRVGRLVPRGLEDTWAGRAGSDAAEHAAGAKAWGQGGLSV